MYTIENGAICDLFHALHIILIMYQIFNTGQCQLGSKLPGVAVGLIGQFKSLLTALEILLACTGTSKRLTANSALFGQAMDAGPKASWKPLTELNAKEC